MGSMCTTGNDSAACWFLQGWGVNRKQRFKCPLHITSKAWKLSPRLYSKPQNTEERRYNLRKIPAPKVDKKLFQYRVGWGENLASPLPLCTWPGVGEVVREERPLQGRGRRGKHHPCSSCFLLGTLEVTQYSINGILTRL